jgi:hypothetical protein
LADFMEGVGAGIGDVLGCGVCLGAEPPKSPDYLAREKWVMTRAIGAGFLLTFPRPFALCGRYAR